ncbi:hypothetical protein DIPPA_16508 [Diplonema papillatum]|nr:hypothetical protein DIPPA_16508 [Diplonema papillatum]
MSDAKRGKKKVGKPTGPRQWAFDDEGNIVNFSFKALRQDVLTRLRRDNLYTLEECKVMIREMLKYATAWLEVELAQIMYVAGLYNKLLPDKSANFTYQWPQSVLQPLAFEFPTEVSAAVNPRFRIGKLVEELNKSLIRLADTLLTQRKERLLFAARLLEDIEAVHELK